MPPKKDDKAAKAKAKATAMAAVKPEADRILAERAAAEKNASSQPATPPAATGSVATLSTSVTDPNQNGVSPTNKIVPLSLPGNPIASTAAPLPELVQISQEDLQKRLAALEKKIALLPEDQYAIQIEKIFIFRVLANLLNKQNKEEAAKFSDRANEERDLLYINLNGGILSHYVMFDSLRNMEVKDAVKNCPYFIIFLFFEKYFEKFGSSKNITLDEISKAVKDWSGIYIHEEMLAYISKNYAKLLQDPKIVTPTCLEKFPLQQCNNEKKAEINDDIGAFFHNIDIFTDGTIEGREVLIELAGYFEETARNLRVLVAPPARLSFVSSPQPSSAPVSPVSASINAPHTVPKTS
jgi:hypothetical protein